MLRSKIVYLCDKKKPCSGKYACLNGLCSRTTDADHAKNGAIRTPSEAVDRFDAVLVDENVIYYIEMEVDG